MTKLILKNHNGNWIVKTNNNHIDLGHHGNVFKSLKHSTYMMLNENMIKEKILDYYSARDYSTQSVDELIKYLSRNNKQR